MIRLITVLLGALAAVMISLLWVMAAYPRPKITPLTKLERTCRIYSQNDPRMMAHVPCHLLDEYLQPQWKA